MSRPLEPRLAPFFLRLFILLPLCFAAWYVAAPVLLYPAALVSDALLRLLMPEVVAGLVTEARMIQIDTRLLMQLPDGRSGSPTLALDPLIYAYNLPVLYGLVLAGSRGGRQLRRLLLGYLVLLPAWVWGICFGFAKTVGFDLGPEVSAQMVQPGLWLEVVALGYQFGYLVLPVFALVLGWYLLCRSDLAALTGARLSVPASPQTSVPPHRPAKRRTKRKKGVRSRGERR